MIIRLQKIYNWIFSLEPRAIMKIDFLVDNNSFVVYDWYAQEIKHFSKPNKDSFFQTMKEYCRLEHPFYAVTSISIWKNSRAILYHKPVVDLFMINDGDLIEFYNNPPLALYTLEENGKIISNGQYPIPSETATDTTVPLLPTTTHTPL